METNVSRVQLVWQKDIAGLADRSGSIGGRTRNVSVIAHVDHGKSTLTDVFMRAAGISMSDRTTDTRKDEQELGVTIKSTPASFALPLAVKKRGEETLTDEDEKKRMTREEDEDYLCLNVIDCPGHVDFSSEVTAALRLSDGALLVVDAVEGIRPQTETVIIQAVRERVKIVLLMNKLDRLFTELRMDGEDAFLKMRQTIDHVNDRIRVALGDDESDEFKEFELDPIRGNVAFGSGYFKYAFTIGSVSRMNHIPEAAKAKLSSNKQLRKALWGDFFWNEQSGRWVKKASRSGATKRGFCRFVYEPLQLMHLTLNSDVFDCDETMAIAGRFGVDGLNASELVSKKKKKERMEYMLSRWMPASEVLVKMLHKHIPSPQDAARDRLAVLYNGPKDSPQAMGMAFCNPDADLVAFVSKLIPVGGGIGSMDQRKKSSQHGFIGVTRIFSGTIRTGDFVYVLGSDADGREIRQRVKVRGVFVMIAARFEKVGCAPAGSIVGVTGIDDYLVKSGTIVGDLGAQALTAMSFSVSCVVSCAVSCRHAKDRSKLTEGLRRLAKADPLLKVSLSDCVISAAGELHLEASQRDLCGYSQLAMSDLVFSDPIIPYMETITQATGADGQYPVVCVAKSPNKLNRLYFIAKPLPVELVEALEEKKISPSLLSNPKELVKEFEKYGWSDDGSSCRVWTMGATENTRGNVLLDCSSGVSYLHEIRDLVCQGFQEFIQSGVLAGEAVRGVEFRLVDAKVHSDPPHRGVAQVVPATRRALSACMISGNARLVEPIYKLEVTFPSSIESQIRRVLGARSSQIVEYEYISTDLCEVVARLPVAESIGFSAAMHEETQGRANPSFVFCNWWRLIDEDPLDGRGNGARDKCLEIRARKGLRVGFGAFSDFYDRM